TQRGGRPYLYHAGACARNGGESLPLEGRSDLGRRTGSQEVNMTLVELFPQDVAGILTVLDPRFHPGMSALASRVVAPKTSDDAATYDLVQGPARSPKEHGGLESAATEAASGSPWERPEISKQD